MKKIVVLLLIFLSSIAFASTSEINVGVNGMVCGFCAQGISKKFSKEPAVDSVKVSLENKIVAVKLKEGQDLSDERITSILKDSGYTVSKIDRNKI